MRPPQSIGKALQETLAHFKLDEKARNYEVITRWAEIVGEKVSQFTQAEKLDRGVLTVQVTNQVWRYELSLRSKEIVRKIAETCCDGIVKEIRWKV
jgi:predicted nucleic acid-binding Zn ribbon protein